MKYIALHHVPVAGEIKTPGEIFDGGDLTPEKIDRLIGKKAIRALSSEEANETAASAGGQKTISTKANGQKVKDEDNSPPGNEPDEDADEETGEDDEPDEEPGEDDVPDEEANEGDETDEDEGEEADEAPPEIDALDGVESPANKPAEETPAAKPANKAAGKKKQAAKKITAK